MSSHQINSEDSLLLIIDLQERLSKVLDQKILKKVVGQIDLLATLASDLKIPLVLTRQYPQGLGQTIKSVQKILEGKKFEQLDKITFGCCDDTNFNNRLASYGRKKIILCGMETHVCIYLTALGLLGQGYQPFIVSDAVISREKFNYKNGLTLMRDAGCVVTNTETLLFGLMVKSGGGTFKKISGMIKKQ